MNNIDKIREWVDKLKPRFTSSNSHHVDRAHVTKAEFDSLLALLDGLGDDSSGSYTYFVSYATPAGNGRCEITRSKQITTITDIEGIENVLGVKHDIEVSLINYILLSFTPNPPTNKE